MGKNILIFSDGTGQEGGLRPDQNISNIYKLYRATRTGPDSSIDPAEQIAFYDAGLGTTKDEGPSHIRIFQSIRKIVSAGLGIGISRNIADCYEAILKHYEPGDRIFLFGFSRGAYTVRCVADVMTLCGIPTRTDSLPYCPRFGGALRAIADEAVGKVYEHGAGHERGKYEAEREEQGRRFRKKYGSDDNGQANVVPYYIGVFDTVAALGAKGTKRALINAAGAITAISLAALIAKILLIFGVPTWLSQAAVFLLVVGIITYNAFRYSFKSIQDFPKAGDYHWHFAGWRSGFYDKLLDKRVEYGRHALAIDETRKDFARVPWGYKGENPVRAAGEQPWLKQIWFAGDHSDIGGSYPEDESRLSDVSLNWMVQEAKGISPGLIVDDGKLHLFPSSAGMQHSEVLAQLDRIPGWYPKCLYPTWEEELREVLKGAIFHPTVSERFKLLSVQQFDQIRLYRPDNLKDEPAFSEFYRK